MNYNKTQTLEVVIVIVLAASIIFWISDSPNVKILFVVITILAAIASIYPRLLAPLTYLWFKFGHVMGFITNKILLAVIFYLMLTPLSRLRKLFSVKNVEKNTGWIIIEKNFKSDDLIKQF